MPDIEVTSAVSAGLGELEEYFSNIRPPYTLSDIRAFNHLYQRLYPRLDTGEKVRAEQWVDWMIDHVERKEWVSKIYGVV
jgi:hypothetical protein